jgi:hypothetical protein
VALVFRVRAEDGDPFCWGIPSPTLCLQNNQHMDTTPLLCCLGVGWGLFEAFYCKEEVGGKLNGPGNQGLSCRWALDKINSSLATRLVNPVHDTNAFSVSITPSKKSATAPGTLGLTVGRHVIGLL